MARSTPSEPAPRKAAAPAKKAAPATKAAPAAKKAAPVKKVAPPKKAAPVAEAAKKAARAKDVAKKGAPARKAASPAKEPAKAVHADKAAAADPAVHADKAAVADPAVHADKAAAPAPAAAAVKKSEPARAAPAPKAALPAKGTAPPKEAAPKPVKRTAEMDRFFDSQKVLLLEERATYTRQATSLRAEADQLALDREPGDVQFDEESGQGDTMNVERERDLALSAQALAAVEEIDRAMAKIVTGTYGVCERCGTNIPRERLKALPYAALCVQCKSGGLSRR